MSSHIIGGALGRWREKSIRVAPLSIVAVWMTQTLHTHFELSKFRPNLDCVMRVLARHEGEGNKTPTHTIAPLIIRGGICMEYRAEKATASLHGKTSLQKVNFRRVLTPDWLFGDKGLKVGSSCRLNIKSPTIDHPTELVSSFRVREVL